MKIILDKNTWKSIEFHICLYKLFIANEKQKKNINKKRNAHGSVFG